MTNVGSSDALGAGPDAPGAGPDAPGAGPSELETELLSLAVELADAAGDLVLRYRSKARGRADSKRDRNDLVTQADKAAERLVVETIRSARPEDGIVGEEGSHINPASPVRWVVDPLDGTINYVHGCGPFGVSIGVEIDGRYTVGVVRAPLSDETFMALAGHGAYRNGVRITHSGRPELATAVIGFDSSTRADIRAKQSAIVTGLFPHIRELRRIGCGSIAMCWVAAGRLDGFFVHDAGPWDISAGTVIGREAGAWVGSSTGEDPLPAETISATPAIAPALRDAIRAVTPTP